LRREWQKWAAARATAQFEPQIGPTALDLTSRELYESAAGRAARVENECEPAGVCLPFCDLHRERLTPE
jgi:hypothetical protein